MLIKFVTSLKHSHLIEFWLPYTAHLLVSATIILLRCLLESTDLSTKRTCAISLVRLRNRLRHAKESSEWDLADFCVERCSGPIEKIATAMGVPSAITDEAAAAEVTMSDATAPLEEVDSFFADLPADLLLPVDSFDYPFDALWDNSI